MDEARIRACNAAPARTGARYVLYDVTRNPRVSFNHVLAYAAEVANGLDLPLLYFESLDYPEPNDRMHSFRLEGVPENARRVRAMGAGYVFALRRTPEIAERLAADAAVVVTDDYPRTNPDGSYAVDSSCVVPMSVIPGQQYAAYTIRPKIHKVLDRYLRRLEPVTLRRKWRGGEFEFHTEVTLESIPGLVAQCEIDHRVPVSVEFRGGALEAEARLERFLEQNLSRYARHRNDPSAHATSRMSPYLHHGQVSALEVAVRVREYARAHKLIADEFLEELIVRRELAFNFARYAPRVDSLEALPEWARRTLAEHASDERSFVYTYDEFAAARTHDPLWNATQQELLRRGVIHGYYRMYWGKKIIEWSRSPAEALRTMIAIHDRWALDGRDPATYTNILWCFGLHDRPWPERPVFGKVRYMSFDGMRRKTDVDAYLREIEAL